MTAAQPPIEVQRINLAGEHWDGAGEGEDAADASAVARHEAALYVMVAADGFSAKVGALEKARNAEQRLHDVAKDHPTRKPAPAPECFPIRLAVVATLQGLVLGPYGDQFYERWAQVEHLEWALRLVLARRLGRLAGWTDWIHIDKPVEDDQWSDIVEDAWQEVSRLGRADPATPR